MASVGGVSSNNLSSLYGSRNVISGLASGMDTEAMIENSVSGIRTKINSLLKKQTKLSWQQEAYRSITDKMVQLTRKYTSYTSSTNLFSAGFFNKAVQVSANGANASKVSATGKSNSSVVINGVRQLATASRYQVNSSAALDSVLTDLDGFRFIQGGEAFDLTKETFSSKLSGSMTLTYGTQKVSLSFDDTTIYENPQEFADAINAKLEKEKITIRGATQEASKYIKAEVAADDILDADGNVVTAKGSIVFKNLEADKGDSLYVSGLSGKLNETLGKPDLSGDDLASFDLNGKELKSSTTVLEQIAGKTMTFTMDGTTKTITLPSAEELKALTANGTDKNAFVDKLNAQLTTAFGSDKVSVGLDGDKLTFTAKRAGSNLTIKSEVGEIMGLSNSESTYLNTGKTLSDLLGLDYPPGGGETIGGMPGTLLKAEGKVTEQKDGSFRDEAGNKVDKDGNRLGKDGKLLYGYDLTVNGKKIGTYTRETSLDTVLMNINSDTDAGVSVTYSQTTNQFVFSAKETGKGHDISIDGTLGKLLFGTVNTADAATYTAGQDAIVNMTVNGATITAERSSNTFNVDGLDVTLKETFNYDAANDKFLTTDPVTFTSKADADKIVDAVKSFVEDYNAMVKELRAAFSTVPAQNSKGGRYEPMTDEEMEGWSESAIKSYEDKAKQGLLFGDSDLSSLYSKMTSAISPGGADGAALRGMGISTVYSEGLTTIELDEEALRTALSNNPDSVRDAFSKVAGEGSTTNGLMANLKNAMDTYASTDGGKGILINKAGSKYSALSLMKNSLKTQMENYDGQITKWQNKLSDKVDYYTRQFTRLEQLVSQMNSQGSSIMQMMGGNG